MRRAATDERTGEVREIKTRKDPEKAVANRQKRRTVSTRFIAPAILHYDSGKGRALVQIGGNSLALAITDIISIHAASPVGHRNVSRPRMWRTGSGIQRTSRVNNPIRLP